MALKRWAIHNFAVKTSLVDGASNWWTASGSGTNEFYYNQDALGGAEPRQVFINGTAATKGTRGELTAGQWGHGDGDTIGQNRVYVRLSDGADPDTKSADHVQAVESLVTRTLLTAAASKETILLSLLFSNYSSADDATLTFTQTDGTNDLFEFNLTSPAGNSPVAIDSKLVLEPADVITITSDIDEVSVIAGGDES